MITVVVLLILATISIRALTGENGIINQTKDAKEGSEIMEEREAVEISAVQAAERNKWGEVTEKNLEEELTRNIGERNVDYELIKEGDNFVVTYISSNRSYLVDAKGNIIEAGDANINPTIIFGDLEWSNQKANVKVSTRSSYDIEYKVNEDTMWSKIDNGSNIQNLSHGDNIEARLMKDDEVITTKSLEVKDEIPPKVTEFTAIVFNYGGSSKIASQVVPTAIQFNEIRVKFNIEDNETGLTDLITVSIVDRETGTKSTQSLDLQDITLPCEVTFGNVTSSNVDAIIEVYDNAGNRTEERTTAIVQ